MTSGDALPWVFSWLFTLVPMLAVAGMVGAVLWTFRVPRAPVAVPRGDGTFVPLGAPGAPPVRFFANLLPGRGVVFVGEAGVLDIADGQLSFTRPDADGPDWRYPVRALRAQHHVRMMHPATLDLWLPNGQVLLLEVSRSPLSRWVRGTIASMQRPAEAHVFLQVLAANGATVSSSARWPVAPGETIWS